MLNRRDFLRTLLAGSAAMALPSALQAAETPKRPNIVLFLVDDMGWQDCSLPFWRNADGSPRQTPLNRRYRTPNLERLAQRGMLFTDAYAQAICSPSRISLMTGMNSARHHVTDWTLFRDTNNDERNHPTLQPLQGWAMNGLQPEGTLARGTTTRPLTGERFDYTMAQPWVAAKALPQCLAEAGYVTIHCGKAHFGAKDTPGANPQNLGFRYNIAGSEIGGLGSYRGKHRYGSGPFHVQGLDESNYIEQDTFITEALTQEALKRLEAVQADPEERQHPFFLYMAHYAIHAPFTGDNVDARFADHYEDPKDGLPWNANERNYATLIEGMDRSLGQLMDWLDTHHLTEHTLILFLSDNGGLSLASSGRLGDDLANAPLSFGKGSGREGGIRIPFVASFPGVTSPGSINRTPILIEDLFPTLLEVALQPAPVSQTVDGQSLLPLFRGGSFAERSLLFHQPNLWGEGSLRSPYYGAWTALRRGKWKLLYLHAERRFELFDLEADLSESTNLADREPLLLSQLVREMDALCRIRGAQFTTYKVDDPARGIRAGTPVPFPLSAFRTH